jgi:D-alanine-D-alanine ligase
MHILVLAGGNSNEREVSLRSGESVRQALELKGHQVTMIDPAELDRIKASEYDIAFPVLHGRGGEDGIVQTRLEQSGVPYVCSDVSASELCFDKILYKRKLLAHELPTPTFAELLSDRDTDLRDHPLTQKPFVVKPVNGGSSIDTFVVRDPAKANFDAIADTLSGYGRLLLEELVVGQEITVAVLEDQALPVIEIIPPESGEFDYENKYNGATQELCPPLHIAEAIQNQAGELAATIHKLCGCADFSRTDMMINDQGELLVLETNTIPGMTDQSLFPKAATAAGIAMPELCDQLVQTALKRQTANA